MCRAFKLALVVQDGGTSARALDLPTDTGCRIVVRWLDHGLARVTLDLERVPSEGLLEILARQYLLVLCHLQLELLLLPEHLINLLLLHLEHLDQGRFSLFVLPGGPLETNPCASLLLVPRW